MSHTTPGMSAELSPQLGPSAQCRMCIIRGQDGSETIVLSSEDAALLQSLLCRARPRGEESGGGLSVRVFGKSNPGPDAPVPVCEK